MSQHFTQLHPPSLIQAPLILQPSHEATADRLSESRKRFVSRDRLGIQPSLKLRRSNQLNPSIDFAHPELVEGRQTSVQTININPME